MYRLASTIASLVTSAGSRATNEQLRETIIDIRMPAIELLAGRAAAAGATPESFELIGLNAFFITITVILVVLRTYTRVYILQAPGIDDCLAGLAAVRLVFFIFFFFF